MRSSIAATVVASTFLGLAIGAPALAGGLEDKPALQAMLDQFDTELGLSDEQTSRAESLIGQRIGRVKELVDESDDFNFDTVVDLLVEARSIREEFIPELEGLLDAEQKQKLKSLPRSHEIYVQGMVGWLVDERVDKLKRGLDLSEDQVPEIRDIFTEQTRDSVEIVEGLVGKKGGARQEILDAVMDLRGAQRRADRRMDNVLDDGQKARFEQLKQRKKKKR